MSRWRGQVRRILDKQNSLRSLNDRQLRKQSLALRYKVLSGSTLDSILPEAFALVREAATRAVSMSHYEVQLIGGMAMHFGGIAVMQTGEGKTLTATLPMYLAALEGKGAHLVTANDYLAARDAELMKPVYEMLGMSVGVVNSDTPRPRRQQAYACDMTYSTAKEIGFDFLRDRIFRRGQRSEGGHLIASMVSEKLAGTSQSPVQREMNFILIDEADSILIDEARTPLIVSSMPDAIVKAKIALYKWAVESISQFEEGDHFEVDAESSRIDLSADGRKLVRKIPQPDILQETPVLDIYEQVEQALFVDKNYIRDRHYVIRDGEVVIVDEFTGRLAEGRKWRSGIHQSIEAREGLEVTMDNGQAARVTVQDLFLRYDRLCGMTGTVANSGTELRKIYGTRVVHVPTNKPPRRKQWPDRVFATDDHKWDAIAAEVIEVHKSGRPVLIGTRSIDKSERLSQLLTRQGINHDVLNARHLAREADIVSGAGQVGRVTVATNMAGRGTDIKISSAAHDLGGLHVICTELHDSARIDRQLIGRCGRQGDPGTYRQFMSYEDDILETGYGEQKAGKLKKTYANRSSDSLAGNSRMFRAAQQKIETRHFQSRKMLLFHEKNRQEVQREMGQDPYLDTAGA
ncbi:MAG: helicase-related protein [Planctomycetota bacterium]